MLQPTTRPLPAILTYNWWPRIQKFMSQKKSDVFWSSAYFTEWVQVLFKRIGKSKFFFLGGGGSKLLQGEFKLLQGILLFIPMATYSTFDLLGGRGDSDPFPLPLSGWWPPIHRSNTFMEIDHEIFSTVILLQFPCCCQLQAKVCE